MIPEYTGEWMNSDRFDAVAIHDMAKDFSNPELTGETFFNIKSAWHQARPHPDTGTMIEFCWENPAAWKILGSDVDREWFMEQMTTQEIVPPLPV